MSELPEYRPPKKRSQAVILMFALIGLVLANLAAHSFVSEKLPAKGWALLVAGLASLAFVLWRAIQNRGR